MNREPRKNALYCKQNITVRHDKHSRRQDSVAVLIKKKKKMHETGWPSRNTNSLKTLKGIVSTPRAVFKQQT